MVGKSLGVKVGLFFAFHALLGITCTYDWMLV